MKKKLLFVFNPKSGKGLIKEHLVNIVDIMTKAGYKITIYPTQCQGDAIKKVRKNAEKYDLVVCSGGDGTLDEVVTGMEQSEVNVPIGYIPASSFKMESMPFDAECRQRVRNVLTKKVSATDAISELNKKYRVSKKQVEGSRV